jgi:hypothetical protein
VYFISLKESRIPWFWVGGIRVLEAVTEGEARHGA